MVSHFLIVGGSSGISLHLVKKLLEEGHTVTSLCRTPPPFEHPNLHHQAFDVTDPGGNFPSVGGPFAGLAYFPGTINLKPFNSFSEDDFRRDWEINFLGATRAVQTYLPQLEAHENASILFMSTVAVQRGMPFHSSIAASKGALEGLTLSLAAELAPKIRVNAIAPSLTDTPLSQHLVQDPKKKELFEKRHPLKKLGTTEDLSNGALFLLTEKSSWLTGQVLHIDGGLSKLVSF